MANRGSDLPAALPCTCEERDLEHLESTSTKDLNGDQLRALRVLHNQAKVYAVVLAGICGEQANSSQSGLWELTTEDRAILERTGELSMAQGSNHMRAARVLLNQRLLLAALTERTEETQPLEWMLCEEDEALLTRTSHLDAKNAGDHILWVRILANQCVLHAATRQEAFNAHYKRGVVVESLPRPLRPADRELLLRTVGVSTLQGGDHIRLSRIVCNQGALLEAIKSVSQQQWSPWLELRCEPEANLEPSRCHCAIA